MKERWQEERISAYFRSWLDRDNASWDDLFDPEVVYSECYGPQYRGLGEMKRWFSDWNRKGKVTLWDISTFITEGNETAVLWRFGCTFDGNEAVFDGVSIVRFNSGRKIVQLREFESKAEHCFPYGSGDML